jgi:hypothetical protein
MLESPGSGTKVDPDILDEGRTRLQRKLIIAKKDHVDNNVRRCYYSRTFRWRRHAVCIFEV